MKHTYTVTIVLVLVFLMSQVIGLLLLDKSVDKQATQESGVVTYEDLPYDIERPDIEPQTSFVYILVAVIIGTVIVLLLIRFRRPRIWKYWYLLSVVFTLSISFSVLLDSSIAFGAAIILAILKVFRPNVYLHNLTELFVYSGIALIFVPIMNTFAAVMLMVLIFVYDMYAVLRSKHMVAMARFQQSTNLFACLSIPYKPIPLVSRPKHTVQKVQTAVLGGGDMAFPLLFAGVIMKTYGFYATLPIPIFSAIALFLLLYKSEKGKFYPAMPFISAGCFLGYAVTFFL